MGHDKGGAKRIEADRHEQDEKKKDEAFTKGHQRRTPRA